MFLSSLNCDLHAFIFAVKDAAEVFVVFDQSNLK